MYVEDNLTEDDARRIDQSWITPRVVASGCLQLLGACETVRQEIVIPVVRQNPTRPSRETALILLCNRILWFCQTAVTLDGAALHHQSLISAERSVIELWLDMQLVHRNVFPDGVERIMTFTESQKTQGRAQSRSLLRRVSRTGQNAVRGDAARTNFCRSERCRYRRQV